MSEPLEAERIDEFQLYKIFFSTSLYNWSSNVVCMKNYELVIDHFDHLGSSTSVYVFVSVSIAEFLVILIETEQDD